MAPSFRSIVSMKLLESIFKRGRAFLVDVFVHKARTLKFQTKISSPRAKGAQRTYFLLDCRTNVSLEVASRLKINKIATNHLVVRIN